MNTPTLFPDLRAAILKALAGSSSQAYVAAKTLLGHGERAAVQVLLDEMFDGGEINTAAITHYGVCTQVYWLTGVVTPPVRGSFVIDGHTRAMAEKKYQQSLAAKIQPKTSIITQEITMQTPAPVIVKKVPAPQGRMTRSRIFPTLCLDILTEVAAHPGIRRDQLLDFASKKYPTAGNKKITKAIWDMVNVNKKLTQTGSVNERIYFASVRATPSTVSVPAVRRTKPAPAAPSAPAALTPVVIAPAEPAFGLMLSDDYNLFITLDEEVIRLNPMQLQRLDTFMTRVFPDGVRV